MKIGRYLPYAACMLLLVGCKPTERNYQAAYEAAQQKRQKEGVDPDMILPAGGLQRLDAPKQVEVDGEKVNVKRLWMKYVGEGEAPSRSRYSVAVSRYKMPTNAKAQAANLKASGLPAYPAEGSDAYFYVVAGDYPDLPAAASFAKEYASGHPASQIVGLEEGILIIDNGN